ncbi:hypothetical protein BJY24_005273 [Nocardia transvalensis]|uniref:Excreted virulence factor EspC (Type VII ESX diderm) n=1 Tax=Nocardia transvalensis TaxID=37333 RepID=A0A7W9PHN4_9NOCA|nr:type VII secretion target [Nocardia transvalensis]MBB5916361.1 hypothetical protein [Nocardia transvalensis]
MTEDFRVVPDDLDKLAGSLLDLAGQAATASGHATKWMDLADAEMRIYGEVKKVVDQIRENVVANYNHLQSLAQNSSAELTASAQMYRTTETESARKLDAAYPTTTK